MPSALSLFKPVYVLTVLSKVKVSFTDTVVRLEHLPKEAEMGAALEIRLARWAILCFTDTTVVPAI